MNQSRTFWVALAVFEVIFGAAIFGLTRQYYLSAGGSPGDRGRLSGVPVNTLADVAGRLNQTPGTSTQSAAAAPAGNVPPISTTDPNEIFRLANEAFNAKDYARAATLYEHLLNFDPDNPNTLNDLGLTLQYTGRSDEAIERLNQAVLADPTHQRSWLTLGFVYSQMGNTTQARAALTRAVDLDSDPAVTASAQQMLGQLP